MLLTVKFTELKPTRLNVAICHPKGYAYPWV